jgi:DNA-binding LacI/PurR family transcriptional regulator
MSDTSTQNRSVTLKQIAEMAGCSAAVASTVLNNSRSTLAVSEGTRQRIQEIARRHNYRPHLAARMMKNRKSQQIGVLLTGTQYGNLPHPAVFEIVLGINEGLERAGYLTSLVRMTDIKNENLLSTRLFEGHLLDGLMVVNLIDPELVPKIESLVPHCIWVDTDVWKPESCIRRDEVHAGRLAAQALVKLGYKRLLVIEREREFVMHFSFAQRLQGVEHVAQEHSLQLERFYMRPGRNGDSDLPELLRCLSPKVGVVALDAYGAQKIAIAASSVQLQAGYDYGLVCCDDHEHSTEQPWPGLNRVAFNRYAMGVQAAEMMLRALQEPAGDCTSQLMQGSWVCGNTAWGPRPGAAAPRSD